jgi:tetratricopeptide (TPR) repeat protein
MQLGDHEMGLAHCQHALDTQREIGDRFGQADTLDSIAYAYGVLARHDEAAACYRQALQLYREFGDRYYEAQALSSLGDSRLAAGDPESAVAAWQEAVTILDELGLREAAILRAKLRNLTGRMGGPIAHDRTRVASTT